MKASAKRLVLWGGLALGITLIALLVTRYDPESVLKPLLRSKPHLLLAVIALQAAIQVLNAATPATLLGPADDGQLSLWSQARVFLSVQPLAMFAPARLSDFGAVPLLRQHHQPGAVASSLVIDRLITMFFLLLLTPLALRVVWPGNTSAANTIAIIAGLGLVVSAPFLLASKAVRYYVNRYLLRLWPSLLQGFGAHTAFLLHASRARLLANFGLTAFKTLLAGAAISILSLNVGVSVSLFTAIWMSVLIQLATSVPIAPQGLGIAEGTLVLLFEVNGLPGALALSVGVMGRVLFIPVIGGIYLSATLPLLAERLGRGEGRAAAEASPSRPPGGDK